MIAGKGLKRIAIPSAMLLLTAAFVTVVWMQLARKEPHPAPVATQHTEKKVDEIPKPVDDPTDIDRASPLPPSSAFADLIRNSGIVRVPEAEQAVRARILEYFALLRIESRGSQAAHDYTANRAELEEYLASLPPEMVPVVMELLEEEKFFVNRHILIRALGRIGSDLAADALAARFEYAIENGRQKEVEKTVEALGLVDSDHSFDLLDQYIDRGEQGIRENRHRFVEQLGNHSQRGQAVGRFLDLAGNDSLVQVRNFAAQALKKTADPHTAVQIEAMLTTEHAYFVRQTMIGALGAVGDPGSLVKLEEVAHTDDNPTTRESAAESIYKIGKANRGTRAREILESIAASDTNEGVRVRAKSNAAKLASE